MRLSLVISPVFLSWGIKFVDATSWNIEKEEEMAAVCNLLIHDLFPGEHHLAFLLNEDLMDLELDNRWNEQVCLIAATDIISSCETISLQPADYIVKPDMNNKCRLSDVCDIECSMSSIPSAFASASISSRMNSTGLVLSA